MERLHFFNLKYSNEVNVKKMHFKSVYSFNNLVIGVFKNDIYFLSRLT